MLAACILCRGCGHDLEPGFFRFWAELWQDPFPVGGRLFSASRASCISWLVSPLLSSFWPAAVGHILLSPKDSPPLFSSPYLSCLILSLDVCDSLNVGPSWNVQTISVATDHLTSPHLTISSLPFLHRNQSVHCILISSVWSLYSCEYSKHLGGMHV